MPGVSGPDHLALSHGKSKVLIVGAGVAGLVTALCLQKAGIEAQVFEQSHALSDIGAGLQLSPNAMKVLHLLGLIDEISRVAFAPEALEMRLGTVNARIFKIPMGSVAVQKFGAPYLHVHRADLIDVLNKALWKRVPAWLHLNKQVTAIAEKSEGIELGFSDGTKNEGDVLIGADGIRSSIQTFVAGPVQPRFTGNTAWRLTVSATPSLRKLIPPHATVWVGPGRHAVTYYVRRGELINFVGVVEQQQWRNESWTERGDKSVLASDFDGWVPAITEVIQAAGDCYRWALFDRDPLQKWVRGRATIIGDAAHAMLPFLAQGAAMAMEDACVLADRLSQCSNQLTALKSYEAIRKPRTTRVQLAARRQMALYHQRGAFNQIKTYGPMWLASKLAPGFVNSRQDWLYSFDATVMSAQQS